ncbi:Crp/Fnr family transcriptional regulator [Heyndrickxia oleronia]|uniref:Cyclic nucleotide-binding protein n=1 Tax=Heyndrickxia oleronia TaxID=38875 RepID=A0A8E2LDV4_9BACI|nr:Crp/Fnr family transcriptional regulator [Heyndrickxia oleronia]MEC1376835.1 Crp/Fnr family transcriptional regulator [Heyndrickxia oleronia]OJH17170.1 cyclic nucleotide-binding protein [Bacillus obstructivus]OOP67057.1 cyclic nucleotide-binding protein [Heyndrickxia oleronia]QQZ03680.1 Crp/Fnr family transcriptional regulator [Heyndrickxia oleronia]
MNLKKMWEKYGNETEFNFSVISEFIDEFGTELVFEPNSVIISRGDFPNYVYFIKDGIAMGLRDYEDGSDYSYFQVDKTNGNIGLLEIMSRREQYIATITCLTKVTAVRIESALVYQLIMSDISLLRRCSVLLAEDLYISSGNDGIFYQYKGIDRVRYFLIRYYERNSNKNSLTRSIYIDDQYKDIASQIGLSIRTVGRSIKQLKELNEISSSNRKLTMSKQQYIKMKHSINE